MTRLPLHEAWAREKARLKANKKKRMERDKGLGWPVPAALRRRVVVSFGVCEYCGCTPRHALTIDRIIPGARGGTYVADNITGACAPCNTMKRDRDFIGPVRSLADMEGRHV